MKSKWLKTIDYQKKQSSGLEGLVCIKGGMKRYWVLVKIHGDVPSGERWHAHRERLSHLRLIKDITGNHYQLDTIHGEGSWQDDLFMVNF
ncbi:MAG: hypothetical protein NTZ24_12920 [Deltaproteobacteria bacterium]|nr:hypothetical protein [Deltaproteobacteria bacterium]